MTEATAGPWSVGCSEERDFLILGAKGEELAVLYRNDGADDPEWYPAAANARLIAAAPELYAALKAIVLQFGPWHAGDCPGDDTCDCTSKPFHDAVNAAIKKVEGR